MKRAFTIVVCIYAGVGTLLLLFLGAPVAADWALTKIAAKTAQMTAKAAPREVEPLTKAPEPEETKPAYMVKSDPLPKPDLTLTKQLMRAIKHLVRKAPKRELFKNPAARLEMALYLRYAAEEENLDPFLILYMAFRESSLKIDVEGDLGEETMMQVHGKAKTICENASLDLELLSDQLHCGALYLRTLADDCGGLICAMNAYASGHFDPKPAVVRNTHKRLAETLNLAHLSKED